MAESITQPTRRGADGLEVNSVLVVVRAAGGQPGTHALEPVGEPEADVVAAALDDVHGCSSSCDGAPRCVGLAGHQVRVPRAVVVDRHDREPDRVVLVHVGLPPELVPHVRRTHARHIDVVAEVCPLAISLLTDPVTPPARTPATNVASLVVASAWACAGTAAAMPSAIPAAARPPTIIFFMVCF